MAAVGQRVERAPSVQIGIGEGISVARLDVADVVRRHQEHALPVLVRVHLIVFPGILVVVDVRHHKTVAVETGVEAHILAVVQEVILVVVAFVVEDERLALVHQGLPVGDVLRLGQLYGFAPSAKPSFVACIARRAVGVAIIGPIIHHVEDIHAEVVEVAGIVEVGEAQAMGKLVADGADAVNLRAALSL